MFEVLSLDWWGRHRTEGYGYITLPSTAGLHHVTTHTWRPTGNSPVDELRRFFIGGNPELDDITFVGIPHQHEVCVISLNDYCCYNLMSGRLIFHTFIIMLKEASYF